MNTSKPKPILYSQIPRFKGKYKNEAAQFAIKRLCYVKDLRFTKIHEYQAWASPSCSQSLKRLFKFCKSFKTYYDIHSDVLRALKLGRITSLSITAPFKSGVVLLKRLGNRKPLDKLTVNVIENISPKLLRMYFNTMKKKFSIANLKFKFPKKPLYTPAQKEIDKISKILVNTKGLHELTFDANYFTKLFIVKTLFKPLVTLNITTLSLLVDFRGNLAENFALALSHLASMKTLRSFELEWGHLERDIQREEAHMDEVVKAFKIFLKNQFKLVHFTFKHRPLQGTCSLVEVYQGISKLKTLESLTLWPYSGDWTDKDTDAFIVALSGHPKLNSLDLLFTELPQKNIDQFNKKLTTGLQAVKSVTKLRIGGNKIPGFTVDDPGVLQDLFKNLVKLEFSLSLGKNNTGDANIFGKLISVCTKLEELVLSINPSAMTSEKDLSVILSAIGNLDKLILIDLSFGRIKREGSKNLFSNLIQKMENLWCYKLKFGEAYFTDEELINLSESLIQKQHMRSVIIVGSFLSNTREVKDFFVINLRAHSIKTPPLA